MVRMIAPVVGLLAAGAAAVPSNAARESSCTTNSQNNFQWTVSDFQYNTSVVFTTPAHQNDNGVVKFSLTSPVFPGKAASQCVGYSTRANDFFYGDVVFNCTAGVPEDGLTTTFTYNGTASALAINQSWACAADQTAFAFQGLADLKLDCEKTLYTNPNWQIGETLSSTVHTCTTPDFELAPSTGSGVAK